MRKVGDQPETVEVAPLQLRAEVSRGSVNVEARTAELVFSTGAPVMRFDWTTGQRYMERLSLKPGHVRLERLNAGAPFLNSHSTETLGDVLGVVVAGSARLEKDEARATVRLSRRASVEPVWQDVQDGIIRNVSVGYRVHKYEQSEGDGKIPVRTAIDWEPFEISAVPIPADAGAQVRAEDRDKVATNPCVIVTRTDAAPHQEATRAMGDENREQEQQKDTDGAAAVATVPNDIDRGAEQERLRIEGILAACEAARCEPSVARRLIRDKTPLVDARGEVLDLLRARSMDDAGPRLGPSGIRVHSEPMDHIRKGITGAFLHRVDPEKFPLDEVSRNYRGRSLLRCAELVLEARGFRTGGMSGMDIARDALNMRAGLHSTSDFPNILEDVANKTLRAAYTASPQTFAPITRRVTVADFKNVNRNQLGEFPALAKVNEHGEFTSGTIGEGKEVYRVATYGKIFGITRQAIVNDDLNAFARIVTQAAQAARNLESDLVWYQILKNAAMGDTVALFHSSHGNISGGAGAIDVTTLGVARSKMRKQTGLDGVTFLNLSLRHLLVPPDIETVADQYTTQITPAQGSSVNPFAGRLTVIAEPRLAGGVTIDGDTAAGSATVWYGAASLDQNIDMLELALLEGQDAPVVETMPGWRIDGIEWKCRHDVGAKAIDHRGFYRNSA